MGASILSWWLKKEKDEDKSEEQWKTIWVVVLVIIFVLLSGLAASVAVFILNYNHGEDQTQSWTKGVEGYPAWEEVVDLILEAEQSLPEIVNVGVIGRCVHLCTCVYLCTLVYLCILVYTCVQLCLLQEQPAVVCKFIRLYITCKSYW